MRAWRSSKSPSSRRARPRCACSKLRRRSTSNGTAIARARSGGASGASRSVAPRAPSASPATGGRTATRATTGAANPTAASSSPSASASAGSCRGGMTDPEARARAEYAREVANEAGSVRAVRARAPYVELHCHSAFSLLDGASHPAELVDRAVELGYHALAITDHDELGGIVAFAQAGEGDALECIVGAEITVEGDGGVPHHLVLLAEDRTGYGNLSPMITRARMDCPRGRPSLPLSTVAAHAKGLFALTGCPRGLVPRRLRAGDAAGAREAAARLHEIFDGRLAIECWDHGLEEERALIAPLVEISRAIGVPWVVTNNVHYARASGRVVHDVLSSLRHQRTLDEMGTRLRPNAEWRLQSPARMVKRWSHHPDGVKATLAIAERCAFRPVSYTHLTLP